MDSAQLRQFVGRIEDDLLLRGQGRYIADVHEEGQVAAVFVRSPHAFALVRAIDVEQARRRSGVLAILTAADLDRAGAGTMTRLVPIGGVGTKIVAPEWPALARDRVLYVGQPVALVVAETPEVAEDAAELVSIDYEELAPVVGIREALAPDAPQIWPDAPGNIAVEWSAPLSDGAHAERAKEIIASAPHVARLELKNQRIAAVSLEPRGATASYDASTDQYLLRCGSQSVWTMCAYLSAILGLAPERLRVISDDVGGAFGMKSTAYPEYVALLVAAEMVRRPIHWLSSRSESFMSDNHARDMILSGELALDNDGRFLALNVEVLANMGAVLSATGPLTATVNIALCLPSVYQIPHVANTARCVFTNSVQTGAYRGAGRPEANYLIERLIDVAADLTKIDPVELRRRNFISPDQIPYRTPVGMTYDSGSFPEIFEQALKLAGYADFPKRRAQSQADGKLRGIGIGCYLEQTGGALREGAAVAFPGNGTIELRLGSQPSGQGHLTVFRDLLSERLGLPKETVNVRQGDTELQVLGSGAVGSRSAVMVGGAMTRTVDVMLEKGRKIAAWRLEAAEADIEYRKGAFTAVGTDHSMSLFEVAAAAAELRREGQIEESLDTNLVTETPPTYDCSPHDTPSAARSRHIRLAP